MEGRLSKLSQSQGWKPKRSSQFHVGNPISPVHIAMLGPCKCSVVVWDEKINNKERDLLVTYFIVLLCGMSGFFWSGLITVFPYYHCTDMP